MKNNIKFIGIIFTIIIITLISILLIIRSINKLSINPELLEIISCNSSICVYNLSIPQHNFIVTSWGGIIEIFPEPEGGYFCNEN